jgi:hypothetical protein
MPVPFSYSTQRPTSEADSAPSEAVAVLGEMDVLQQQNINPFDAMSPTGNTAKAVMPFQIRPQGVFQPANFSVSADVQLQTTAPSTREIQAVSHAPTTHLFQQVSMSTAPEAGTPGHELTAHFEQLRNDLFSAATNISALSDRLERLESRPATSATFQTELATLRSDIERWITHHLEAAVEQSMRRIWERSQSVASQ